MTDFEQIQRALAIFTLKILLYNFKTGDRICLEIDLNQKVLSSILCLFYEVPLKRKI